MRGIAAAILALCSLGLAQAADGPVVRAQIDGQPPYLIGQPLHVVVDVLVPNYFMSGLEFPDMELPGTVISMPDESAQHLTEMIGGQTYAGIRRSFIITPQREGEFALPPARIAFRYAAQPGQATAASVTLPPQKFSVQLPAGAQGTDGALPVAKVMVSQTLDRAMKELKAGDALVRTVETFAENTQAMMIPPPEFTAPDGVRVYDKDPVLIDETGPRGGFIGGRRTDRVTYVFEKAGDYVLPAIEIGWYNPATDRKETARAPEIQVSVAPNPQARTEIAPEAVPAAAPARAHPDRARMLAYLAAGLLAALAIVWALRRWASRCRAWVAQRRRAHEESEPAYFARARHACRAGDPGAAYMAILAWQRRSGARADLAGLEDALFGPRAAGQWNGESLAADLARARGDWLTRSRHVPPPALPELNPQ